MISLSQFQSLINYLINLHSKENEFSEKYGKIFTVEFECSLFNIDDTIRTFEILLGDPDDWLGYFYFECDCSLVRLAAQVDTRDNYDLSTIEGFYKMLMED